MTVTIRNSILAALLLLPAAARAQQLPAAAVSPTAPPGATPAALTTPAPKAGPEYVAVMASFAPELESIIDVMVPDKTLLHRTRINGIEFDTAELGGKHYVFFLTGMSLVNAAMNTQLAIDRFNLRAVFFTGIAGGIDPAYGPGDVVVPARWHYHSEAAYFNETAPGQFALAGYFKQKYKNFGMIFPDDVTVIREGQKDWAQQPFFSADDHLLLAAKKATDAMPLMKLGDHPNKVTYGGDGVSGTVFCDNAEYRKWIFDVWKAECLDMESTAIAQVCWENKTPCLIVRGLSDLAGGQTGMNTEEIYLKAAADHSAAVLERILQNFDLAALTAPLPTPTPKPAATPTPTP